MNAVNKISNTYLSVPVKVMKLEKKLFFGLYYSSKTNNKRDMYGHLLLLVGRQVMRRIGDVLSGSPTCLPLGLR